MIDFEKELDNFKPINEIDDIESAITDDDLRDIMDLLREVSGNKPSKE